MRFAWVVVVGCAGAPPPAVAVETPPPAEKMVAREPVRDGVYFGERDACVIEGAWMACIGNGAFVGATSNEQPSPPRRDDPYLDAIERRLPKHVFVRLDDDGKPLPDAITMESALLATVAGKDGCERGVMFPDPTWNRSIALAPAAPAPPAGKLGTRTYLFFDIGACDPPIDPMTKTPMRKAFGGVRLFAEANGEPIGLMIEGYMSGSVWVTRGATKETIARVFEALK